MGEYIPSITKRVGNLIFSKDGTVWANYLLTGINVNPYNTAKISACQESNEALFSALSQVAASDFLLLGVKIKTPPGEIIERCTIFPDSVPPFSRAGYPELTEQYSEFYKQVLSGRYAEYHRVYWLSIALPNSKSWYEQILSSFHMVDPHRGLSSRLIKDLEQSYFDAIPPEFNHIRTTPEHVRWIFDRARLRGITVPSLPNPDAVRRGQDGPRSFPEVMVSKNADTESLLPLMVDQINEGDPEVLARGEDTIRRNFRSMRWSKALAVHNLETRSEEFPDGYTSYQSSLAIARYPAEERYALNTFTYLVDQEIGLDADFALRFSFNQELVSTAQMSRTTRELDAEDLANSRDRFESAKYSDRRSEVLALHDTVRQESAPRGMEIAAVFTFAHQNKRYLDQRVRAVYNHFLNNDFTPLQPVGGQFDLWKTMMPGASTSSLVEDLKQVTTAKLFSGFMPIRRTFVGDSIGIPIAINTENALGQIVHYDILNATDKGNASVAATGAQGAGKSLFMKNLFGYMVDLNRYVHLIDQTEHGEYVVYGQSLTDIEVVDVVEGWVSMDILKCFPDKDAARIFLDLYLPMLGIPEDSPQARLLAKVLDPGYRQVIRIHSTRSLIEHIKKMGDPDARLLQDKLAFWAELPYTRTFIDPIINGKVVELEPFTASSKFVVFWTRKLSVYRGDNPTEAETSQRFAAMAYNAIALMTADRFSKIEGPCAFGGDEMAFLKGSAVLEKLIKTPDRTGRKNGNFVIAGAQLASDFDENYDLIKRKLILRQETRKNAEDALEWGGVPTTERMIVRMLEDTSPPDPDRNNFARIGREGEGWYNDGNFNIARIRTLPPIRTDRFRYADTTSSRMIRAGELDLEMPESAQEAMAREREVQEARMRALRDATAGSPVEIASAHVHQDTVEELDLAEDEDLREPPVRYATPSASPTSAVRYATPHQGPYPGVSEPVYGHGDGTEPTYGNGDGTEPTYGHGDGRPGAAGAGVSMMDDTPAEATRRRGTLR